MPYNPWVQFRRQRASVDLPTEMLILLHEYPLRPLSHSNWPNHAVFSPVDVPRIGTFPAWLRNIAGAETIPTAGVPPVPPDLLDGIKNYGAILEDIIGQTIRGSARGAVVYDPSTDRLYYGASRFVAGLPNHGDLEDRIEELPVVLRRDGEIIHTRMPNLHAHTCAEFQALNRALFDGAQERHLQVWCFRAATMEPSPRCDNFRVTVSDNRLNRIWTC
jgi:hypothetical protein